MTTEYNYTIEHPGEVFLEKLQELGMSVKEFAVRACKPEKTVIDVICQGRQPAILHYILNGQKRHPLGNLLRFDGHPGPSLLRIVLRLPAQKHLRRHTRHILNQ